MLKYLQVKQKLIKYISHYTDGYKLPNRVELSKTFNTTRATLDKAISELMSEGFLRSSKGSGTYIAAYTSDCDPAKRNWWIVLPNITEEVYQQTLDGIRAIAGELNANIVLNLASSQLSVQERLFKQMMNSNADGAIIIPTVTNNLIESYRIYNGLVNAKLPIVFCNRAVDGINAPLVTSNDFYGGYIATKNLITRGHRHIAYVAKLRYKTSDHRCDGYLTALLESGIPINQKLICSPVNDEVAYDYKSAFAQLFEREKIDAVFCFSDAVAIDIIDYLKSKNINVPDDVGVVGYTNNAKMCEAYSPKITSVSYQAYNIGFRAGKILNELIRGTYSENEFPYFLFQPKLIIRET